MKTIKSLVESLPIAKYQQNKNKFGERNKLFLSLAYFRIDFGQNISIVKE